MSELIDSLRRHAEWSAQGYDVLFKQAADRIAELEAENDELHADLAVTMRNRGKALARIEELETALRDTVEWLDRTDRDGCAHTEHARRALGDDA